jgi:ferric-dicitrate binding protein FerR (iron transport regulator)
MEEIRSDMGEIIVRFLDGSSTPAEEKELSSWLNESESNKKMFLDMKLYWDEAVPSAPDDPHVTIAFDRFRKKISANGSVPFLRKVYLAAVSVAAVLILGLITYTVRRADLSGKGKEQAEMHEVFARAKTYLQLEDGTKVWLNRESRFKYPEHFKKGSRDVELDGEAYFEVTKNAERPFVVHSEGTSITVLGTIFNFRSFQKGSYNEAVLKSGHIRMKIDRTGQEINVMPNQRVYYARTTNQLQVETVDASLYCSWKNPRLEFDNQKLGDVIVELEKWYNIEITCPKELEDRVRVSFVVEHESMTDVLNAMKMIAPITWSENRGKIVLQSI